MGRSAPLGIRRLGGTDRGALERFSCRDFKAPWTDEVEQVIQTLLPDLIVDGLAAGLGAWNNAGDLCAVTAWRPELVAGQMHSIVLAVATGKRRRGFGLQIKRAMIAVAREAGATTIVSRVHVDNDPMLALNRRLGAQIAVLDPDVCACILPIDPEPW